MSDEIGVVQVRLESLNFEVTGSNTEQVPEKNVNKSDAIKINKLEDITEENKIYIRASLPIKNQENGYKISTVISGIFLIDEKFEDKFKMVEPDEDVKALLNRISGTLTNKFILVSTQLSTEANNYPIIPNLQWDSSQSKKRL